MLLHQWWNFWALFWIHRCVRQSWPVYETRAASDCSTGFSQIWSLLSWSPIRIEKHLFEKAPWKVKTIRREKSRLDSAAWHGKQPCCRWSHLNTKHKSLHLQPPLHFVWALDCNCPQVRFWCVADPCKVRVVTDQTVVVRPIKAAQTRNGEGTHLAAWLHNKTANPQNFKHFNS